MTGRLILGALSVATVISAYVWLTNQPGNNQALLLRCLVGRSTSSTRPGRVRHVEDVDLPRPRTGETRLTEEVLAIKRKLWHLLEH